MIAFNIATAAAGDEADETDSALEEAAGEQATAAIVGRVFLAIPYTSSVSGGSLETSAISGAPDCNAAMHRRQDPRVMAAILRHRENRENRELNKSG